jgi:hypothetical protein
MDDDLLRYGTVLASSQSVSHARCSSGKKAQRGATIHTDYESYILHSVIYKKRATKQGQPHKHANESFFEIQYAVNHPWKWSYVVQ